MEKIACHELYPSGILGEKHTLPEHLPHRDSHHKYELLKERYAELGTEAVRFLDGIIPTRRYGKNEAWRVLGLLTTYRREDLAKALERAARYRAFSFAAVERILGAQAHPRSDREALQAEAQEHLPEVFREPDLSPRPTSEYQRLLEEMEKTENAPPESEDPDDDPSA